MGVSSRAQTVLYPGPRQALYESAGATTNDELPSGLMLRYPHDPCQLLRFVSYRLVPHLLSPCTYYPGPGGGALNCRALTPVANPTCHALPGTDCLPCPWPCPAHRAVDRAAPKTVPHPCVAAPPGPAPHPLHTN